MDIETNGQAGRGTLVCCGRRFFAALRMTVSWASDHTAWMPVVTGMTVEGRGMDFQSGEARRQIRG